MTFVAPGGRSEGTARGRPGGAGTALVLALLVAALSAACGGGNSLEGTRWNLVAVDGAPAVRDAVAWIAFESDGAFAGSTGCNSMSGRWKAAGRALAFSDIVTTLIACPDPVGAQETAFVAALRETEAFTLDDETLRLEDREGVVRLTLAASP